MTGASLGDHVRVTGDRHPDGVYRVVGAGGDAVTLLRVGDGDGKRVHTGQVISVDPADVRECAPAETPDRTRGVGDATASAAALAYWSARAFGRQLAASPLATAVAVSVVALGVLGDAVVPLPSPVPSGLIALGSLGLAYVGSGKLS